MLLDVHLGTEDSSELLAELRADGIPVAVVTGSADIEDYEDVADARAREAVRAGYPHRARAPFG